MSRAPKARAAAKPLAAGEHDGTLCTRRRLGEPFDRLPSDMQAIRGSLNVRLWEKPDPERTFEAEHELGPDRVRSLRPPPRFTKSDARNQLT